MTVTPPATAHRTRRSQLRRANGSAQRARPRKSIGTGLELQPLGSFADRRGRRREVIAELAHAGSVLVVDRDAQTRGDRRLLAHLGADEPPENAELVCRRYLEDARAGGRSCRRATAQDLEIEPFARGVEEERPFDIHAHSAVTAERLGCSYCLSLCEGTLSIPELRWRRCPAGTLGARGETVSLREAVGRLERYEPMCSLTERALRAYGRDADVSIAVLRLELARVRESPIVLNRRLREVVLATLEREQLSMSEIAIRCGRVKRDSKGNESGETSWLARRLGILPEGGKSAPTPWIHSDVLALIARRGLGIGPREVEA
jgi:hypothetical protein